MADMSTPLKGVAFTLCFTLYKNDGTVVANPGTYTKKVSIDGGAVDNIAAAVTEEDTTYGQLSLVLSAAEMNGDWIWIYVTDDTAGTVPLTMTIYPAAYNAGAEAALVHAHAATIEGDVAAVHTHAQAIIDDVALVHTHANTIDGHITADYGATEKACVDLLDDANGLVNIHDTVDDVHTDVGTAIADVAATHVHAASGETQATAAAASLANGGFTDLLIDDLHADVADVHTDVGTAVADVAAVHVHAGTIEADTNELQTDWVNAGRLDAILDAAAADAAAGHAAVDLVHTHVEDCATATVLGDVHTDVGTAITNIGDVHATDLPALKTVVDNIHDTDLPDVHTDIGTVLTNLGTVDTVVDGIETHVHAVDGHIGADYGATEKAAIDLLDDAAGGLLDIHTDVADVHTDVGTAVANVGDVHTDVGTILTDTNAIHVHAQAIVDDVALVHTHVGTIDGHITADYTATEKAAIDLLDDAVGGLLDVHTDVADVHGDVTDVHTDVGAIVDGVWDEAIAGHAGAGSTGLALAGASAPTANAVADQVWDEVLAGHAGVGSTGEALASAGAAGDPWNTTLPGAYGAGKAGKIVGDNVNAPLATIDTVADAIKAKTDTIGAGTVTVTSPVASDGVTVTTYRGDDYKQHEGREIRWLIATPDLSTAVTTLHVGALDIVCTLVDGGLATQSVYAELTAIQTVTLLEARGLYSVTAAMADADVRTLVVGEWKSEIRVV
jgi:hypothetical protein